MVIISANLFAFLFHLLLINDARMITFTHQLLARKTSPIGGNVKKFITSWFFNRITFHLAVKYIENVGNNHSVAR